MINLFNFYFQIEGELSLRCLNLVFFYLRRTPPKVSPPPVRAVVEERFWKNLVFPRNSSCFGEPPNSERNGHLIRMETDISSCNTRLSERDQLAGEAGNAPGGEHTGVGELHA